MSAPFMARLHRAAPLPGTGRLGVVSAYFQFAGIGGVLSIVAFVISLVIPRMHWRTMPSHPLLALLGVALMTAGFFRTSQLLDQRQKAGARLAALCFAGPFASYVFGSAPSRSALIVAGAGLALVASVWRHLE